MYYLRYQSFALVLVWAINHLTSLYFLGHPKLKLFISQGGLQSTDEAICSGVPLIAIPMISDQWYNAEKIARHGIGIQLNMESVTEESLNESINYVIRNGRFVFIFVYVILPKVSSDSSREDCVLQSSRVSA